MEREVPEEWSATAHRQFADDPDGPPKEFREFQHASGDVRVHVSPTEFEAVDRPGYAVVLAIYPSLEIGTSGVIRSVYRYDRALELAVEFMAVFSAVYDGAGTVESAAAYAARRIGGVEALDDGLQGLVGGNSIDRST